MSGLQTETTQDPTGGNLNVGWIDAGDWMSYNVNIPTSGTYRVIYRVASPNAGRTLRLEKDAGSTQLGSVTIPNTGSWQTWTNVYHNVTLPAGSYALGIATATGGFNINYFRITSDLNATTASNPGSLAEVVNIEPTVVLTPNPVRDQLYIQGAEKVKTFRMFNMQGQQVLMIERPSNTVSVHSLKPGLHIAVIEGLDHSIQKVKLIKE
jgi:hypothetical protein